MWHSHTIPPQLVLTRCTTYVHPSQQQVTTNQAVDLVVLGAEGSTTTSIQPFEVSAAKGKSTLCLPGSGSYVLSPRGCYIFSSKSYSISVGGPSTTSTPPPTLQLTASRAYVDGLIRVAASPGKVAASPHTSGRCLCLSTRRVVGGTLLTAQ